MMFLILGVGVLCYRKGVFDESTLKRMSILLLQVVNPAVILISYQISYTPELLRSLGFAFVLSVVAFLIQIIVGYLVVSKRSGDHAIERLSVMYSNCGYFGLPLAYALFGQEGVFYLTSYLTVFSLFFWTQGVILMVGKARPQELARNLLSPAIIVVFIGFLFFILKIRLPSFVYDAVDNLGSMNTPLAMLIAGATLGKSNIDAFVKRPRIYLISFYRLILVPAVIIMVFRFTSFNPTMLLVIIIAAASPIAVNSTMFALKYEKDSLYASQMFIVTTLLAVFSIPTIIWLAKLVGIQA